MAARNVTKLRSAAHLDPADDPALQAECALRIGLCHIRAVADLLATHDDLESLDADSVSEAAHAIRAAAIEAIGDLENLVGARGGAS